MRPLQALEMILWRWVLWHLHHGWRRAPVPKHVHVKVK